MNSDRGAVQQTFDFLSEGGPTRLAELLRPESTDPARNDQPALSASSRGTQKQSLLRFVEPPYAAPHVRWCGGWAGQHAQLPDLRFARFHPRGPRCHTPQTSPRNGRYRIHSQPRRDTGQHGTNKIPHLPRVGIRAPEAITPPERVHSGACHRSVRRWPSSHAAVRRPASGPPRFQSRPRLRRLIVTSASLAW